jgi:hypothetical protein
MATSPTSQSATTSGAAKDDAVGLKGDYTFTIVDLLANDPGGAAKVDVTKQFLFGTTKADWDDQGAYLAAHGITANDDGSFTINGGATDFQYMVQIGNKGTWSTADVDVTAPTPHLGANLFTENFDGYDGDMYFDPPGNFVFGVTDLNDQNDWTGTAAHTELGANGYGGIASTSGNAWLDTQNSPGPIDISHTFTDTTAAVNGKTSVLSFDIATQDLWYQGVHYATSSNATFDVKIDNAVVAHFNAADFDFANQMQHVEVDIAGYADAGNTHTLELVDTSGESYTGFAIDSIQINDWIL